MGLDFSAYKWYIKPWGRLGSRREREMPRRDKRPGARTWMEVYNMETGRCQGASPRGPGRVVRRGASQELTFHQQARGVARVLATPWCHGGTAIFA